MNTIILKMRATFIALGFCIAIASTQSASAKINVVVSIKPIHSLVAGVMQGVGEPHLLVESGSPHSYALKPSDASALQEAGLVVWIGPKIETFLTGPLKSLASKADIISLNEEISGPKKVLTIDFNNPLRAMKPIPKMEKKHRQSSRIINPHSWLSPDIARSFIFVIAATLTLKEPVHKEIYWSNARNMISRLDDLTRKIRNKLSPLKNRPYLTLHDSFYYFENYFHLNHAGSISINSDRQPGVRHLRNLQRRIKTENITCIFTEPQFRSRLVDLVVEGTNVRTATLDPLGAHIKKGPELYFSLLKNNAQAFVACLGKK